MQYRKLGNSGLDVSVLGLGTNNFGARIDEAASFKVIDQALEVGVNFLDTANAYGDGQSEQIIGNAMKGRRQKFVIGTKFFFGQGPNNGGGSRKHMFDALEASLKRLQTDYVDLYMIHRADPHTPIEETLRALDDAVHQGKVRYTGCCNFEAWRLVEAAWMAKLCNLHHFVCAQNYYNVLNRGVETELTPACVASGTSLMPFFPLESGLLTGKYKPGQPPPPGTRLAGGGYMARNLNETNLLKVQALQKFAEERGHNVGELAHAYLLANPAVDTVISGATKPEQVVENAKGLDWVLSADDLKAIDKLVPK